MDNIKVGVLFYHLVVVPFHSRYYLAVVSYDRVLAQLVYEILYRGGEGSSEYTLGFCKLSCELNPQESLNDLEGRIEASSAAFGS
jgi:hypothetical protein